MWVGASNGWSRVRPAGQGYGGCAAARGDLRVVERVTWVAAAGGAGWPLVKGWGVVGARCTGRPAGSAAHPVSARVHMGRAWHQREERLARGSGAAGSVCARGAACRWRAAEVGCAVETRGDSWAVG